MKKPISPKLLEEVRKLCSSNIKKGIQIRDILPIVNDKLKENGHPGYSSEKSLYNLVNSFDLDKQPTDKILDVNKSLTKALDREVSSKLKAIGEFSLDLQWQNVMTKDMAARLYKRFIAIDEKGEKANNKDLIDFAKATREFIDLGVKIDALNAKKVDINIDNKTQVGIALYVNGDNPKRLEEVTATIIQAPQLEEASYG